MAEPAMMKGRPKDDAISRRGRRIALVVAGAMLLWMAAQWVGSYFGWPLTVALIFDGMAFVAFGWALTESWSLWRARKDEES